MTARRAKPQARQQAAAPTVSRHFSGETLVLVGVALAMFGTPIAILPGGHNPFGPIKALVLLAGAAIAAVGFALSPDALLSALRRISRERSTWPALGLVAAACIATATSIDASQSLVGHYPEYQGLLLLLVSAFVGFSVWSLRDSDTAWETLGQVAIVCVLAVAAYAALQFFGIDPVSYQREFLIRRVRSTLGNASNLGVFLCLALPFVIARARAEKGAWRVLGWIAALAGGVVLAWSLSRGAWLGALGGALAWVLAETRGRPRASRLRITVAVVSALVAVVVLVAVLVPSASGRLTSLADPSAGTPGWRVEVWTATARLVAERPVLGFGPASFRYAFPPRRTAEMLVGEGSAQVLDDPHNLFASVAVSGGVLALAMLLWLLGEALVGAWRSDDDVAWRLAGPALVAATVAGVLALQFHFATLDSAPLLAGVVGLAVGRGRASRAGAADLAPAEAPTSVATRAVSAALAVLLATGAISAAGLTLADRRLAAAYGLVGEGAPWEQTRAEFSAAQGLAPWEPAMVWAEGRGATQWMSATQDPAASADASAAFARARAELPLDPLVAAQSAEAAVVSGLLAGDPATLERAAADAQQAITLDPQNGWRWETRGVALGALGKTGDAIDALKKAVEYAPQDAQAWENLARMYDRSGDPASAANARTRAMSAGTQTDR